MRDLKILGLIASLSLGCGGGDGSGGPGLGSSDCELAASLSGALDWSSAPGPGCAIPFGGDEGIWMIYVVVDDPVARFEVDVLEVTEGEVGSFPAVIDVRATDERVWKSADCTVSIESHEFEEEAESARVYIVAGTGECSAPATPTGGGAEGELIVAPFAFRFPAYW